jgi:hypothetical protein
MVPGSIPGGVTGIFIDISPSDRSMALGSTQPLVKMSTRTIPGGKGGWCVSLTNSPPSRAEYYEILEPKLPGTIWATPGLLRDFFTFFILPYNCKHLCDIQEPKYMNLITFQFISGLLNTVATPSYTSHNVISVHLHQHCML